MIAATVASLNQGKSSKGRNSSRSSTRIQNPCAEIFETSTLWEVLAPRISDLLLPLRNQLKRTIHDRLAEAINPGQRDFRLHPELGFTVGRDDMHMHPRLLAREEVHAERSLAKDG